MANPFKVVKFLLGAEEQLADFIQNAPSGGLSGYVRDRYRHRCNEFANLPPWARALSGVTGGSINRFCTPYWDDIGASGPELQPGYEGGQCPVAYTVFATSVGTDLNIGGQTPKDLIGPLGGVTQINTVIGSPFPDTTRFQFIFSGPNDGVEFTARNIEGQVPGFRIAGRVDGQPDNCGDQPDQPKVSPNAPANPGPLPGPEPVDNPDSDNPIPDFPIPPFADPVFGPQPITGPDGDGGGGEEGGAAGGGDGLPGQEDAIGGEAAEVEGGEAGQDVNFGPPPEGKVWVGAVVLMEVDTRIGNIPGTGPQSIVWPSVRGNVALRYGSFYGRSERINSKYFDITRPNTALTVTGCFLQVQEGGSAKVFPISALKCPENPCGENDG